MIAACKLHTLTTPVSYFPFLEKVKHMDKRGGYRCSKAVTAYDFVLQRMIYNFDAVKVLSYSLVLIGFTLLINARRTLGKSHS